ncbi:AAA family ATPase [Thermodesulfobacteriota bacterium]
MAIITISRGSYSKGKEIAEKAAQQLGYDCIARDVLLEAMEEFNVPEVKLVRALHDAPSLFNKFSYKKEKYMTFIQAEILKHFRKDNVVYHGLAGHFFVKGISHVLKIRIISDLEDRVRLEMEREGLSKEDALQIIQKDDEERRKWSKYLYGIDTSDASLYDSVIHIHKLTIKDAVDMICHAAGLEQFKTTPESQSAIDDLAIAAHAKAALMIIKPDVQVTAHHGQLLIKTEAPVLQEAAITQEIKKIAKTIPGVTETKIDINPSGMGAAG